MERLARSKSHVGGDGFHLAATLYWLARGGAGPYDPDARERPDDYAKVANRLAELIDDIR